MAKRLSLVVLVFAALSMGPFAAAQSFSRSGTTSMSLAIAPEAAIRIDTASTGLQATSGTFFGDYTGVTNFSYRIRTSKTGGTGSITLKVSSDFSPSGGPSVASSGSTGDTLKYDCTVASPGSACTTQTASTVGETSVASFGADSKSLKEGTSGNTINWTLVNAPSYSTGTYTATVTFTISAA